AHSCRLLLEGLNLPCPAKYATKICLLFSVSRPADPPTVRRKVTLIVCGAWPDMPHTQNGEMPHNFDLWDISLRFTEYKRLNCNTYINKKLKHFAIRHHRDP